MHIARTPGRTRLSLTVSRHSEGPRDLQLRLPLRHLLVVLELCTLHCHSTEYLIGRSRQDPRQARNRLPSEADCQSMVILLQISIVPLGHDAIRSTRQHLGRRQAFALMIAVNVSV